MYLFNAIFVVMWCNFKRLLGGSPRVSETHSLDWSKQSRSKAAHFSKEKASTILGSLAIDLFIYFHFRSLRDSLLLNKYNLLILVVLPYNACQVKASFCALHCWKYPQWQMRKSTSSLSDHKYITIIHRSGGG